MRDVAKMALLDAHNLPGEIGSGLEATVRYYQGHAYYIVLNFSHTAPGNVSFTIPSGGTGTATVVGENRSVYSSGGTITDNFGSYGIQQTYEWPITSLWYLPSISSARTG